MITELSKALRSAGPELARRAAEEMYRDPFWDDRFGERGRKFAVEDGNYHLTYLVQALDADEPKIFTDYARWLQSVLVHRGMCSAHIAENFARLARLLGDANIANAAPAVDLLARGQEALFYPEGPARSLQQSADAIASAAAKERNARVAAELRTLVWYLADAVQTSEPQLFAAHVAWARGFFERQKLPKLDDLLAALDVALEAAPGPARVPARSVLAQVR